MQFWHYDIAETARESGANARLRVDSRTLPLIRAALVKADSALSLNNSALR
jgi:hypothetical protein